MLVGAGLWVGLGMLAFFARSHCSLSVCAGGGCIPLFAGCWVHASFRSMYRYVYRYVYRIHIGICIVMYIVLLSFAYRLS